MSEFRTTTWQITHDSFPELQLRMFYFTAGDPGLAVPWRYSVDQAVENIYYSWSMASVNSLNWDYKVGLAGNYTINEVEQFKDFALRKVPYAEFPGWVTDRTWKLTTFVARENRDYVSSEGIWEWDPLEGVDPIRQGGLSPEVRSASLQYMLGLSAESPEVYFKTITQGFRAERNFAGPVKPQIYISPIDHKLHLLGAQWGIWNIDENHTIQYFDRNDDGYLDEWQYLENNHVRQQINYTSDTLVYSGNSETIIKRTSEPLSLYDSLPPRNHEDWLALGKQLDQYKLAAAPEDFIVLLDQFGGTEVHLSGATVRDYRPTVEGFRFVLELQPGFTISGPDWLGLQGRAAGEYMVSYDGSVQQIYLPVVAQATNRSQEAGQNSAATMGGFKLLALTPPEIKININPGATSKVPPTQYISQGITVNLGNEGLEDANQVVVVLGASQEGQEISWSEPQTVTVIAGETTPVSFEWAPQAGGEWQLQVQAKLLNPEPGRDPAASAAQVVDVLPAQGTSAEEELSAFGLVTPWQVVVLFCSVVVAAGLAGWVILRSINKKADTQQPILDEVDPGKA